MKTFFSITFLVLSSLLFFNSCGSKHDQVISVDPRFHEYVAAYSSGIQSRMDPIRIELQNPIDSNLIKKKGLEYFETIEFLEEFVSISPKVKGKFRWNNDRVVQFTPSEPLESNALYTISVDLEKVVDVDRGFENFNFQIATYQQKIKMGMQNLEVMDDYNLEWYMLDGYFHCSDLADSADIQKVFTAKLGEKNLPVIIEETNETNKFKYYVDSIPRTNKRQKLILAWNGSSINSESEGEDEIEIPSKQDFRVALCKIEDKEDQIMLLTFSEPISPDQQFNGLIEIESVKNLTFSVSHNIVSVFLPHRVEGKRKIKVSPGVKNIKGAAMRSFYKTNLTFRSPNPRVRIQGEGSILPDSKGLIFPFESIALKSVTVRIQKIYENNVHHFLQVNNLNGSNQLLRFGKKITEKKVNLKVPENKQKQWTQHVLNLEKWMKPEQGAIYRIGIKFNKSDAVCDCPPEEMENNNSSNNNYSEEEWSERNWESYYWDRGYDSWGNDDNESPCSNQYYRGKAHTRNILASNIGIMFKLDDDKKAHAFLTNMLNAQPLANAQVNYVDYTKQIIRSGKTDTDGMLTMKLPRKPFLLVAKHGSQRGYLKLGDGYANSMSKFDVDGERVQNELKGFIYGERGVWRPGDSLFLNFVLQDFTHVLPKNHPINFTLTNPKNQVISEQTKRNSGNNHFDFRTTTSANAPTGIYWAKVKIGKRTFRKSIKIETVKPNRLKMKLTFPEDNQRDSIELASSWLHGAPADKLKANISVEFKASKTTFPDFMGYTFDSPVRQLKSNSVTALNSQLNKKGKAKFKLRNRDFDDAPGVLRAIYTTRVFEKGGNFSIDRFTKPYSPFSTYVGFGLPNDDGQSLINGKKHAFQLITVDENGVKQKKATKLHVRVYRMKWRWWYEENEDNQVNFLGRNGSRVVFDSTLVTKNGQGKFNFGISDRDYGRFMVLVTDENGGHQTGKIITLDYPSWNRSNNRTNEFASMLNFSCDKKKYTKGETVKLSFPSPSAGKALISVETRKRVVKKFWVNTVKGETSCTFETSAEMAPNAFVHVTLIQPHSSTVNDLPIRMYGVVPILVDDPATHLHPKLAVAKEWRPQTKQKITVSEQNGKNMTYTLAVVDDGLLDLTRFRTPNPWNTFFAREALGVRTWDMYNDVIGAYSGKLDRLLSIGGDGEADDGAGPKANRFKPMVRYLGPFKLNSGQKRTHTVDLPAYVGSVRVMVVGHNESAYGSSQETVTIKKPLMVLGTLPRVLGPGETIQLPVNVFAMEDFVKDVQVSVTTNSFLKMTNGKTKKMHFNSQGDEIVNFEMKVAERLGIATIKIEAKCGAESAIQEFEVDVRSANPVTVKTKMVQVEAGKTVRFPVTMDGMKGSHRLSVEMSRTIPMNLTGRMRELIHYPYGCIEQTTSAVFPQLMALEVLDCSDKEKKKMTANIKAGLRRYLSFQTSEGGFAYWPGNRDPNAWGTNYAGHFMLEAEQKGYELPHGLKRKWLEYQEEKAQNWENDGSYITHYRSDHSNQLIQAYRLYTLALAGEANLSSMNRMRETLGLKDMAKWRLAAAYHLAGQTEIAERMISGLSFKTDDYREMSYTYGSGLRDKAMILEACQMIDPNRGSKLAKEIASQLSSSTWLSTQETAYCLLALCAAPVKGSTNVNASISGLGNTISIQGNKKQFSTSFKEKTIRGVKEFTVSNKGDAPIYVTVAMEKVLKRGEEKKESKGLKMTVEYTDLDGNFLNPTKLKQGQDFKVSVRLTNPTQKTLYKEMSLQQIFPSGWEIHNTRFMGDATSTFGLYQDIRDDRVSTFYDLAPNEDKVITIQLNASYLGKFYLPAVYSEAMYKRSVHAQEKGMWVEVF